MPYPARFISSSDYSSTPSSLEGAKKIVLSTPANVFVPELSVVNYQSSTTFSGGFDSVDFIITCDQYPAVNVYNSYVEFSDGGVTMWASIEIVDNTVRLVATYASFWDATFAPSLTLRAVVIPIKTPFSQ